MFINNNMNQLIDWNNLKNNMKIKNLNKNNNKNKIIKCLLINHKNLFKIYQDYNYKSKLL